MHFSSGSSNYLCSDIDGGIWLYTYVAYVESPPAFYPLTFKNRADQELLTHFGISQSQIMIDNVESVFRHLVSVL
jgi:hypothetical protein